MSFQLTGLPRELNGKTRKYPRNRGALKVFTHNKMLHSFDE